MRQRHVERTTACTAVLLVTLIALAPAEAGVDSAKDSRKCRDAIAKTAVRLVKTGFKLVDACHKGRDRGKFAVDCNALGNADPKGTLAKAEAKGHAAFDKRCRPDEPVRDNYPGRSIQAAVPPAVRDAVEASAAALQGAPDLAGAKALGKCHAEIGKARTRIVDEILKRTLKCQKAADKQATVFGAVEAACVADPVKAGPKAETSIAKKCAGIAGADVGSCAGLPGCVVDAAAATGRQLAVAIYAKPSACGDGFRDAGETCPLLEGPGGAPARTATSTMDLETGVAESEIEEDAGGARIARTRLELELAPGATIADVNALLVGIGGDVLMMVEGAAVLLVRIPDPGSLAALDALVALIGADPAVLSIARGFFGEPDVLPENFDPIADADLPKIDHHLAVRAHAAWNARAALAGGAPPTTVVGDFFGDGLPDGAIDVAAVAADVATGDAAAHGYHVLGIVAGRFGAGAGAAACLTSPPGPALDAAARRGCATGMFPGTLPVRLVDYQENITLAAFRQRLVQRAQAAGTNVVLSTSINDCGTGMCGNPATAAIEGRKWLDLVRAAGLEATTLHLASAGNIRAATPAVTDATTNSGFTAAALSPDLVDGTGAPLTPLANVIVVENATNGPTAPFAPACLSSTSKRPGQLAAIGTSVWSVIDGTAASTCTASHVCSQDATEPCTSNLDCVAASFSGTSMATPQMAGLAAYLWALDPTMSVAELRGLLFATAGAPATDAGANCAAAASRPVVDAYAAVLALDGAALPTPATAPIRLALLDWGEDGAFDELDLEAFLIEYIETFTDGSTHGPTVEPATRGFGRFDLNGDGFSGGGNRAPFDLDRVFSPQYGASLYSIVETSVEGSARAFDETALTDLEILCYYAYSDLYTGSPVARASLFDPTWCNPIVVDVDFPSAMEPGDPEFLEIGVHRQGPNGELSPYAGAIVELAASGGTLEQAGGTTDAGGDFLTEAEIDEDASEMTIHVVIRAAAGGPPLWEETVTAINSADPPGVYPFFRGSQVLSGVGFSYFEQFPGGGGREVRLYRDVQFDGIGPIYGDAANDFSPFDESFDQSRSASHAGATAMTNAAFSQRSEITLDPATGELRQVEFEAHGATSLVLQNPGTQVHFWSFADGVSDMFLRFEVVGPPVSFSFSANEGLGIEIELEGTTETGTGVVIVDTFDASSAGPVQASGQLAAGSYSLALSVYAFNEIVINNPAGSEFDYASLDPMDVTLNATLTIGP